MANGGSTNAGGSGRGRFFLAAAGIFAALIVLSFPQTYWIPLATGAKEFRLLRHLHGLAYFAFTALFLWQAWLIATRKVGRHREWGITGAALAGAMFVLGIWLAIVAVEDRMAQDFALPFEFALYNVVDITLICGLVGWSIYEAAHRVEWHRRLVFAAMLILLGAAWSRWVFQLPLDFPWRDMASNLLADLGLVALALHDRKTIGRTHPATVTAALVLVPLHVVEPLIARSAWWNAFAPQLLGFS